MRWRSTTSSGCRSAASSSTATPGSTSSIARPASPRSASSSRSWAARFGSTMRRPASVPITPALTPASTVSVNRLRSSSCWLAWISSRRWPSSCEVIRLKARLSMTNSSVSGPSSGTRASRSPLRTRSAAVIRRPMGATSWLASARPIQTEANRSRSATIMKIRADVIWMPRALALHPLILGHYGLSALHVAKHLGVDEAADEQVGVAEPVEPDQGADAVLGVAGQLDHVARERLLQRVRRDLLGFHGEGEPGAGENAARAVEHHGLGQRPQGCLGVDHLAQPRLAEVEAGALAIEVGRHRQRVGADVLLVLLQIGLGDRQGVVERVLDPLAEPVLQARAQEEHGEDYDDDGRRDRDAAEEEDEARVQPRARRALAQLHDQLHEAAGDHDAEQEEQDQVEVEQDQDGADVRAVGRRARDQPVGGEAGGNGADGQGQGQAALDVDPAQPSPQARADGRLARQGCTQGEDPVGQSAPHHGARLTWMSRSRIFLRSVLRLRPRTSAALSWLPRVAARARAIKGRSTSRISRS